MSDDATTGPLSQRTIGTARRLWGLVYVRAAAYLVAGVLLFANPDEGLSWLRWLVGLVILAQGILLTVEGAPSKKTPSHADDPGDEVSWRLIAGVVSIGAALVVVLLPGITAPVMFAVVGIWGCAAGVTGVIGALRGRAVRAVSWDWQLANAALWIVLGVTVLARPTDDTTTVALLLALYLLLAGAVLLVGAVATGTRNRDARKSAVAASSGPAEAGRRTPAPEREAPSEPDRETPVEPDREAPPEGDPGRG